MRRLRLNFPLVLGLLLLMGLLVLVVAPFFLDLKHPQLGFTTFMRDNGIVRIPPLDPGEGPHPLGTDSLGRDLYSRMIYGARYTLGIALAITILRILLAVPIGLVSGWLGGLLGRTVQTLGAAFSAIPTLILTVLMLNSLRGFVQNDTKWLLVYLVVVTVAGVPRLADLVRNRTQEIAVRPHIEAAVATGARPGRIIRKHILPLMWGDLLVVVASELAWVLLMMGQLAIFVIFVGGSAAVPDPTGRPGKLEPYWPEWAMMMGVGRAAILRKSFLALVPGLALALTAACFHLLSEGLRLRSLRRTV